MAPAHGILGTVTPINPLRGVSVLRLSVLTDETTSPERQQGANEAAARALGIDLADRRAVDLGVSASKTTPFERPELGSWLRRPNDFDALVFWRFDRAVRSMDDMHELAKWARDHKKMIVFAEGPGGMLKLDFRNPLDPMAQLMVTLFAFAAQMEAQAIRERVTSAQAAMRSMHLRWRGSRPPYGYMPEPLEDGGFTLVPDPKTVKVITWIIARLMDGESASAIATKLNEKGTPSPRDAWAVKNGRDTGGKTGGRRGEGVKRDQFQWGPRSIKMLLTSVNLLGWKIHNGNPVRDSEGEPVRSTATPILTRAEFDAVGALLTARSSPAHRDRKDTNALLLRVIHCDNCKGRMYLNKFDAGQAPNYRCTSASQGSTCPNPVTLRADWADEYVEREFLRMLGTLEVTQTREIPGYDPQSEIDATAAEYEAHMASEGTQTNPVTRALWEKRRDSLDKRITELLTREAIPARTEVIRTGSTYADRWQDADTATKRRMLTDAGARLDVKAGSRGGWRRLDERRVVFNVHEKFFSDAAADMVAMADELTAQNDMEAEQTA